MILNPGQKIKEKKNGKDQDWFSSTQIQTDFYNYDHLVNKLKFNMQDHESSSHVLSANIVFYLSRTFIFWKPKHNKLFQDTTGDVFNYLVLSLQSYL